MTPEKQHRYLDNLIAKEIETGGVHQALNWLKSQLSERQLRDIVMCDLYKKKGKTKGQIRLLFSCHATTPYRRCGCKK